MVGLLGTLQHAGAAPITVAFDGSAANGPSAEPRTTPDGRCIVYYSAASNLTPLDTQGGVNVYVFDRQQGVNSIISISQNPGSGILGDGDSTHADISDDSRYVVFESRAANLVPGDTEGRADIFLFDRQTGALQRLTAGAAGDSGSPRISGDGRYVAFQSSARLTEGDRNAYDDVYRIDLSTGTTTLISRAPGGEPANGHCRRPAISRDGTMIAFQSDATNLVPGDRNNATDVLLYNGVSGALKLVSSVNMAFSPDGLDGGHGSTTGNGASVQPAITDDGRLVAFASDATNLGPEDHNGVRDIYVCDSATGAASLVSVSFFGEQGDGISERPDISPDGSIVGFESDATNLTEFDDNGIRDAFSVNLQTGQVGRLSAIASAEMDSPSGFGMVAVADGRMDDPEVFNELPGGFDDTGPGGDDGTIIPAACSMVPFCEVRDSNNMPATSFHVEPGQELRYVITGRTLCLGRVLTMDLMPNTMLPPGATQTPALPQVGAPGGRVPSEFSWTPTAGDTGLHEVHYRIVDNLGRTGTCTIPITVGMCDAPPVCDIDYTGPSTVDVGSPVSFTLTAQAFCEDQPALVEALSLPAGAVTTPMLPAMSNGGAPLVIQVDWTPQPADIGKTRVFSFRTTDAFDQTSECGLMFDVAGTVCDENPVCEISGPMMISAVPGDTITFDVAGSTPCPMLTLTLDTKTLPDGATLTPMTPVVGQPGAGVMTGFSWTVTAADFGSHDAVFTITDDLGRFSTCGVTIDVGACEDAPVCDTPDGDDFIVFMNEMVTFTVRGSSQCPGSVLTLDSDSIPLGAVVLEGLPVVGQPGQPVLATFQWAPDIDGVFTVPFTVTDQTGQSSMCSVEISVVDCDLFPELTVVPDEPFVVAPGDLVAFTAAGTTQCPKTGLLMQFNNVPSGATVTPNPILESGPEEDVGGLFQWIPGNDDAGNDFLVDITLTDTFGRSVSDSVMISVMTECFETEPNNTQEEANVVDADCVYISGKLQKNPAVECEPDTFLVLFNKSNTIINRDDNGGEAGNGWASGLTDLGIRNDNAPRPMGDGGDGLIVNGDGTLSVRIGVTGRPDGLDGVFNGLFLNSAHGQLGAFRLTVTFKNINGAPIVPIGFPTSAPLENPVVYEDVFITGSEAFRINYTAPLGTAKVDVQIDNVVASTTVCDDVDFITIRGLVPLCDYCITQVGGIDCECRPTDINMGWFDKLGEIILTDDNSGPVPGYADLCVVADINGRATIAITGTGDDNFDGLADAWEDASGRASVECPELRHGHGVCGCWTVCVMVTGPHGGSAASVGVDEQRALGDLNTDGRVDSADLAILLGHMQAN
ncbi:MAG: PD40 domain-containing protein [Phycisphaeraceae bacterium]|nr:PD40 domain-containing protein [Phycisphaeraceae bacterium]